MLDTGERPDEAGLDTGARPLTGEDLSILALENETVAGHTCKVIVLDGAVDPGALRASVSGRLPRAPMLSMRLGEIDGAPWWVPAHQVDMTAHVVAVPASGAAIRSRAAAGSSLRSKPSERSNRLRRNRRCT